MQSERKTLLAREIIYHPNRVIDISYTPASLVTVKEHKEEKEIKRQPHKRNNHFNKLGPDLHKQVLSFLEENAVLKLRTVSKNWIEPTNLFYWQKCKILLPLNWIDKRLLQCLQLICDKNFSLSREVNALVATWYEIHSFDHYTESIFEISDDHYRLFKAIILGDENEFFRIINTAEFNFNYMFGFLSPLLIAELFPRERFLKELNVKKAKILPDLFTGTYYLEHCIEATKTNPALIENIHKHLKLPSFNCRWLYLSEGIIKNKPFANIITKLLDHDKFAYRCDSERIWV